MPQRADISLRWLSDRGFNTLGGSFYDCKTHEAMCENLGKWMDGLLKTPGSRGVMYTTWQNGRNCGNYEFLEAFADEFRRLRAAGREPGRGSAQVRVGSWTAPTYGFGDPDPIPCTETTRYPYPRFDDCARTASPKAWTTVELENDKLLVTILPQPSSSATSPSAARGCLAASS